MSGENENAAEQDGCVVEDGHMQGEAPSPEGVRGWLQNPSRSDMVLQRRSWRPPWKVPKRARKVVPNRLIGIIETSDDERTVVNAAKALDGFEKTNLAYMTACQEKAGTTNNYTTVNQYAGTGGVIENKAAVDAAATWLAAMANDAVDSGGPGVVRDEGAVPNTPALGLVEQEAS